MNRNTKMTLLVAGLVLIGFVLGVAAGSGDDSDTKTVTVASGTTSTATVTHTQTVTRTHVRTKYKTRVKVKVKYRTVTEQAPAVDATDGGAAGGDGCSPEYSGACVPDDAGDVDCTELADSDFASVGSDPYGLDADGDGVACES
jgi:hypothetical protein